MNENERKIKVLDMLKYIGKHWVTLIICLVVGAILLGVYGWYKSADNPVAADTNWEAVLTPVERQRAEIAAGFYKKYKDYEKQDNKEESPYVGRWEELYNQIEAAKDIDTYTNSFSSKQMQYYEYLTESKGEAAVVNPVRTIKPKFVVVGAILGVIISAIVLAVIYIVKNSREK